MGWITLPNEIRIYSIADDIKLIHDVLFEFIMNLSPAVIGAIILIVFASFVFITLLSIKKAIKDIGGEI